MAFSQCFEGTTAISEHFHRLQKKLWAPLPPTRLRQPLVYLFTPHLRICLVIFKERGRERKLETLKWERNIEWLLPVRAPTGDRTHNLLVYQTTLHAIESPCQGNASFFFMGKWYSIVWTYHNLPIHLTVDGRLGFFFSFLFWLLWITLLSTFMCTFFCGHRL